MLGGVAHILLAFWCLCVPTASSENCVYSDIDTCRESDGGGLCTCPCIPKCCSNDEYIVRVQDPQMRGFTCAPISTGLPRMPPSVELIGKLKESKSGKNLKFYASTFPRCSGIDERDKESNKRWSYELHTNFSINADFESEYILHSHGPDNGEIAAIVGIRNNKTVDNSSTILGFPNYDPLTSFCVDYFREKGSDVFLTTALSCPKWNKGHDEKDKPLSTPLKKCCPFGEIFQHSNLKHCSKVKNETAKWRLPINGNLYGEKELKNTQSLIYLPKNNLTGLHDLCGKNVNLQSESDIFQIGQDGRLYYTDTYEEKVNPGAPFCVEQIYIHGINPEDYEYEDYEEYDDPEVPTFAETCHHKHPKPHQMIVFYCQEPVIQIRKCCSAGENLNVRAQACTSDMASVFWTPPTVYKMNGRDAVSKDRILNLNEMNLRNLKEEELAVSMDPFFFREDKTLLYHGVRYKENEFCLDYVIDYCGEKPSMSLKAIIADKSLISNKVGTIFGSNRLDSVWSRNFKRFGYTISSFSLILVILVFLIVKELRQDLHGKMVLCIVSSLLIVYVGLLFSTYQDDSFKFISKTNGWCIAQGCITYFFTMSTFGWMSAMSYNIMTKFRVRTIIPRKEESLRFMAYSAYSFGPSLILLVLVLIFQTKRDSSWFRPGIGEESCWFTSCSSGLTVFLYIPISIILVFNLIMFAFSATRLKKLSEKIHSTSKPKAEEGGRISNIRESVQAVLTRQFSTVSTKSTKQKTNYIANKEIFLTYLKLFLAMGLNWSLEVLAWFFTSSEDSLGWLQYLLNFLNMLQGLIMFFVFVFKPTTYKQLKKHMSSWGFGTKGSKSATAFKMAGFERDSWAAYNQEKRLTASSTGLRSTTDMLDEDTSCCELSDIGSKKNGEGVKFEELETVPETEEAFDDKRNIE